MFESLGERLQNAIHNIKGYGKITEENITEAMREIRLALLEADVNYKVVKEFTNNVKEKALGEDVASSINPGDLFVKIVKDELTGLLGGEAEDLNMKGNPAILMLVGLQGSGKTTTIGKLANFLRKKHNKKPLLVAGDVYRPAAIDQLKQLGKQLNIEVYEEGKKDPVEICKNAIEYAKENKYDYKINTEQIPGENAAAKLMRKDMFFYPDADIYDLPLYGNQFMPLGIKATLQERVRVQAMFDGFCNGGSILHANIDAPFKNYETARKMTEYIADQGVTYFAFNTKIQACEENHAFYGTTCPICGKPVETEYTRVVGFLTPIKTWTRERKAEYKMRKWEPINVNFGDLLEWKN